MNERDIFIAALEMATAGERSEFLSATCGGDSQLRERVEGLLQTHEQTGDFLQKPLVERLAQSMAALEDAAETARDPSVTGKIGDDLGFLGPSDQPGSLGKLGHYEVQEVVGSGGMGIVLRAFDERLHRVVAIKVMAAPLATNAAARKRFQREARAAAAVCHDHIVTIHAVELSGDLPYLVMQYVAGMSLQQRIDRDGPLALREILRIGMQTAAGLAAAHAQGLIHRDIKPANILLENGVERVKITDFGLARAAADASVSQTGIVAGTPQYMAPEQARGEALDGRTDLFSLGSVLYAMCTGRAPFRATNSMAVLKRVCDDAPSPIGEANADVPEWLIELIDTLQAKNPDDRYQSAAEVADLLGRRLAQLQHSTPLPALAPAKPAAFRPAARRLRTWAVAAAVFVAVLATFAIAEGTGVTQVAATVIRLMTPDGTLVIETNDPDVKVTIEGDGGLVITGAGLHEVRLKPGNYQLRADKNGKPIPLDQDLVTITRGDKQIVRVRLEATPAAAAVPRVETGAFVVLGGKGVAVRKFDTLAEAVRTANDGDTIEIRGNGPFVMEPLSLKQALTIRAGQGFRPVIKMTLEGMQATDRLLEAQRPLVVEGLEFHFLFYVDRISLNGPYPEVLHAMDTLRVVNCRFLTRKGSAIVSEGPVCEARNCEFLCAVCGFSLMMKNPVNRLVIDNCLLTESPVETYPSASLVQLSRNTFRTRTPPFWLFTNLGKAPKADDADQPAKVLRVEAAGNVFDPGGTLLILSDLPQGVLPTGDWESLLANLAGWNGERNLFAGDGPLVYLAGEGIHYPGQATKSLTDWRHFWGTAEANSMRGVVRYQAGDPLAKSDLTPEKVTPDDFRLRADSPGYRAGKDGKDLGADVDLVGPGPAYERWKKTAEYQQWLKETKQVTKTEAPKVEPQAFVVLRDKGIEVRKFDTLAEAVQSASDGDTIEVRGNGPFACGPIKITQALMIRAGEGFRPVIQLSSNITTHSPLVLDGLELQRLGEKVPVAWEEALVFSWDSSSLCLANCRFREHLAVPCVVTDAPSFFVRNCEFLCPHAGAITWGRPPGKQCVIDNCVGVGSRILHVTQAIVPDQLDTSVRLTHNTVMAESAMGYVLNFEKHRELTKADHVISVESADNIFDVTSVLSLVSEGKTLQPKEVEPLLRLTLAWRGGQNVYAPGSSSFDVRAVVPPNGPKNLKDWKQFWGTDEAGSMEGQVKYQGGDLISRLRDAPEKVTAEDFRLRPDSAGYRAGEGGKDLGADIDLVGPGPAYERWKKTAEYQQWLEETGQECFVQLFNGKDLTGWKSHPEQGGRWTVKDGILQGSPLQSYLFSERGDFDNFHLRVEARINTGGDSSICFRAPFKLQRWGTKLANYGIAGGYDVDLHKNPSRLLGTGSIFVAHTRVEDPSQILFHVADGSLVKADEWFVMDIIAERNHLIIKLNGKSVADCQDPLDRYRTGHIALHVFNAATAVQFRKIEIKELPQRASVKDDADARELAKWQGEWENSDYGRLVIHGERWSSHPKNGFEVVSTIKIVEATDEMTHILLLSAGVDGKVRTIQTILRVDGDTLHNCGTLGSVRPAEFANKPGCIYTQWKRVSSPPP